MMRVYTELMAGAEPNWKLHEKRKTVGHPGRSRGWAPRPFAMRW